MSGPTIHGDRSSQEQWNASSVSSTQKADVGLSQVGVGGYAGTSDSLGQSEGSHAAIPSSAHQPVLQTPGHAKERHTSAATEQPDEFVPTLNSSLYDSEFLEELAQHLESATGLNPKQKQLARFSLIYPDADVSKDPKVNATVKDAVATAQNAAANNVSVKAGNSWKPPKPDNFVLEMGYKGAVGLALEKTGLPEDQRNKLELAHYHPELASPETLEQYKKLGIADSVTEILAENNMAVPEGYKSQAFDKMLTGKYDSSYEALLQKQAGTLTDHQMDALRSAHYLQAPLEDEKLGKIQAGIELSAKSGVQKQFGVSETADFPPSNAAGYKVMMDANYRVSNEELLFKATRDVGADKAPLLRAAILNPEAEGVTPEIRAKAVEITAQSQTKVSAKFSLPKTWQPEGATLMTTPPAAREAQIKTLAYVSDVHSAAVKSANDITDQQSRITAMEFLKVTLAAIDQLRQEIAHQEATQADGHKDISEAQNDSVAYKIKKNREESDKIDKQNQEIADKQKKMAPLANFFKAMGIGGPVLAILISVGSAGTLTGLALAFEAVMLTMSAVSLGASIASAAGASNKAVDFFSDPMGQAAAQIAKGIAKIPGMGEAGAKILADIVVIVVVLLLARGGSAAAEAAGGAAGGFTSAALKPMVFLLISNTNLLADAAVALARTKSGDSANAEMIASMVGAVAGGIMMVTSAALFRKLAQNGQVGLNQVTKLLSTTSSLVSVATAGVTLTNGIYQKQIQDMKANIDKLTGEYDAIDARSQDTINMLKALLKQFEKTLEMLVGMYTDTAQLSGDVIRHATDTTRGLYQRS